MHETGDPLHSHGNNDLEPADDDLRLLSQMIPSNHRLQLCNIPDESTDMLSCLSSASDRPDPQMYQPLLGFDGVDTGEDKVARLPVSTDPMIDLTALLSDLSQYDNRISKLSGKDLPDYPIGDALSLSRRFHGLISNNGCSVSPPSDSTHRYNMPTMLLMLSCFSKATHTYISIFNYLGNELARLQDTQLAHQTIEPGHIPLLGYMSTSDEYLGLRLGQVQPKGVHNQWDLAIRAKEAVSVMLSSLAGVEKELDMPNEWRIVSTGPLRGPETIESGGFGLQNWCCSSPIMKEQTRELRIKVDKVRHLIDQLLKL